MTDPGKMTERVRLQRRSSHDAREGDQFTDLANVWAQFRPSTGREFRDGVVPLGEERGTFTVHWREALPQVDRLIHRGRVWNIRSIAPVGIKSFLDLNATAADSIS